ncbi:NADP-dependent phosphogluconate dehydrogenase [uncultured Algibacter sp.]|uniref:NADP-dependent phosphogluconate dehydrogenase n=1 Tax=uncultured Algibacter sp. TaxID=298659 RepID=UPI0026387530|nr:NADP-dependent phosphogluconate dehydrogenase [uncultured Algibacter sp.]
MSKSFIGVIGLGVMGSSLSLNIAEKGFPLSVFNRAIPGEAYILKNFMMNLDEGMQVEGFSDFKNFIDSLERPRKILIMIKAGEAIDYVIEELLPLLSENDILIDGGNSHYLDTNRRTTYLNKKGISFVGCGVSGGEEGARKGPSIMPGCSKKAYANIAPILEAIAAKDTRGKSCCTHISEAGSGHFVKMVHNGIEYAEMQLLAEAYTLLKVTKTNAAIAKIFKAWHKTDLSSYLLEITIAILQKEKDGIYVLDTILDKAGNKGTGSWSTKASFDLGTVNTMMSSAVFARYISAFKSKRHELSISVAPNVNQAEAIDISVLEKAYRFARLINHHQGFELMQQASKAYHWDLNLSEIARIWTNGCIIRSEFMEKSITVFKKYESYLEDENSLNLLKSAEAAIKQSISDSLSSRIAFDTFWSAYNYWVSMTTKNLPANLIQAQRDYFGAHTYQKINAPENQFFHTKWY